MLDGDTMQSKVFRKLVISTGNASLFLKFKLLACVVEFFDGCRLQVEQVK